MVKSVRLKSVLRNFLNHFETLETRHKQNVDSNDDSIDLYRKEFQTLKDLTESLKTDPNSGSVEGENDVNRRKNRYKDILPYDNSRVILSEYPGVPGSDYMNANYVRGSSGCARAYIASQGPLPNTVVDFWRMIWETDVSVIVMVCNEREAGKYKCESYWPQDNDDPQQYGNITVELVKWRQVCPDFLVRTLKVRNDSIERTVCQFHYQTWPDHGVPNSVHPILELVRLMRDVQITETRPILVHCSAGCGRTGTLCSIDYVWALLRTGKLTEDFSLYSIIQDMRRQRIAMVQTLEQYMLCHKAVATLFEQQLKMIDSHTYENIDGDGEPLLSRQIMRNDIISQQLDQKKDPNNKHIMISQPMISSVTNSPSNTGTDEVRHERLVGKATVIRRPSIAKLKAIFENQNPISSESQPIVRSRSTSSSLNRSQSIKDNIRNANSMFESHNTDQTLISNISEPHLRQTEINSGQQSNGGQQQPIYGEYNSFVHKLNNTINNSQIFDSNSRQLLQSNHFTTNGQQMESFSLLNDQKLFHQNHQQLQQEIRQHIQQKQLQSAQQMNSNSFSVSSQTQTPIQLPIHSQPLPPPPKPPRTYQYHHLVDGSITSVPNSSDGRLIVSVALPRRQTNELNASHNSHYEPIGQRRCNISAPNLVSDSLIVNTNNIETFTAFNMNPNNTIKVMNVSNNNIYESVLPKYRTTQTMEPNGVTVPTVANNPQNQNIHSYYDIMKLRNPGLNSTLPFYDTLYGRHGFMTVPNLRHISVPTITQVQCSYPQFKPNFEAIYSNTNPNNSNHFNNKTKPKSELKKQNVEKISNNFAENVEKSENSKNTNQLNKKTKSSDKKDEKSANNSNAKSNQKSESNKKGSNVESNCETPVNDPNSGTFSKLSNAFKGLRMKSTKSKSKPNTNTTNNSVSNTQNGPTVSRPPHSHRFSPPTQWTQV